MDQGSVVAVFDRLCFGCSMGMYICLIFSDSVFDTIMLYSCVKKGIGRR